MIPDKYWTSELEASPPACAGHEVTQEEYVADFSEKVHMKNPLNPFEPSLSFTYTYKQTAHYIYMYKSLVCRITLHTVIICTIRADSGDCSTDLSL